MSHPTLFNKTLVVVDAMILINFHGLLALPKFISWAKGEIVIEKKVKKEAKYSKAGPIYLEHYIQNKLIIEEEISGTQQEELFYYYIANEVEGTRIHEAEAACLALAISKGYGLACDERVVRNEFRKKCPNQICIHSWGIIDIAYNLRLIELQEANDLKKGLYYI